MSFLDLVRDDFLLGGKRLLALDFRNDSVQQPLLVAPNHFQQHQILNRLSLLLPTVLSQQKLGLFPANCLLYLSPLHQIKHPLLRNNSLTHIHYILILKTRFPHHIKIRLHVNRKRHSLGFPQIRIPPCLPLRNLVHWMLEKGMRKPILRQGVLLKQIPGRVLVQVLA